MKQQPAPMVEKDMQIRMPWDVYQELESRKLIPQEPFGEVVRRLLLLTRPGLTSMLEREAGMSEADKP